MQVFVVFDSAAEAWSRPLFSKNNETCKRELKGQMERHDTPFSANPDHFTLYHVGEFDEDSFKISYLDKPELVCPIKQLVSVNLTAVA